MLAFTLAVSLLAGLLFGLIPAFKYATPHVASALRGSGRSMSHGRERHRARNTLVMVQVALALVLLIGSGLMIRTFQALRSVQPGFTHPEQFQLLHISIPDTEVKDPERVVRMQNEMIDKLAAIPGVTSVAFASGAPMEGFNTNDVLYAEDKKYTPGQIPPVRRFHVISPGYLQECRHAPDRRPRLHLDRSLRQAARRDGFEEHGAGDVGLARGGARQAHPGRRGESVARDRGRGRRRLR